MKHLATREQRDRTGGLTDISQYVGSTLPTEFAFKMVLGDIIMAVYDDVSEDGQDVVRDGIFLNSGTTKECWRSANVIKAGPAVCEYITEGTRIAFPNDKGIPAVTIGTGGERKHIVFINESRLFGILEPKVDA